MKSIFSYFIAGLFVSGLMMAMTFPTQLLKTKLHVTVRNELGNLVEGAKVQLFLSKEDYEVTKNAVATKTTNEKGIAVFSDLEEKAYFVNAEKGAANNFDAGAKTDTLKASRTNKVTIIITE